MEQLQDLLTHMAVGLQRLEADLNAEQSEAPSAEERARRTTLRIATAANRCSWCSVCELACYITTGALARKSHIPVAIFLSRPMFMLQECRRLLQHGDQMLLDAPDVQHDHVRAVDALAFTAVVRASSAAQHANRDEHKHSLHRLSNDEANAFRRWSSRIGNNSRGSP